MRYYVWAGTSPDIKAAIHLAGPQDASQVPESVRNTLAIEGVKKVAIIGDYGMGERIDIYEAIND